MGNEQKSKLRLEIVHVLFIDIVGYSKLGINEQRAQVEPRFEKLCQNPKK